MPFGTPNGFPSDLRQPSPKGESIFSSFPPSFQAAAVFADLSYLIDVAVLGGRGRKPNLFVLNGPGSANCRFASFLNSLSKLGTSEHPFTSFVLIFRFICLNCRFYYKTSLAKFERPLINATPEAQDQPTSALTLRPMKPL